MNKSAFKVVRWVTLIALFIIPFIPLYVSDNLFFPFITGKNFAFRILVEIAFVGWSLLMLADKKYRPRFSWTAALFGLFVIWMAIADAFAVNPAKAFWSNFERMDGWITLIHLFLFFLVAGTMFSVDSLWKKWWYTFLGVSAWLCAYGFLQTFGVLAIHQGSTRLDATFGNSDYLACYMIFATAITLWLALESKVPEKENGKKKLNWLRYILFVLAASEVLILFLTETRGAVLGFVGAVGLGAILWMLESGKKGRKIGAIVLAGLILVAGGLYMARNEPVIAHSALFGRLVSISIKDPETDTRLTIWHMALEGTMQRPVTGWGQEGFNYVFNRFYEPKLNNQEPWFDRAHNMYLDWLIAGGVPALLLFLALLGSAAYALYQRDVSRTERVILLSALAAYCFQGLFVFDNLFSYVPFVAILAIAYGGASRPIKKLENIPELNPSDFLTFALPIGAIVLALMIYFVNVPNIQAAGDLITAITPSSDPTTNLAAFKQTYADHSFANQEVTEQLLTFAEKVVSDKSNSEAVKNEVFAYAMQQAQTLEKNIPYDARIHLEISSFYASGGDFNDAFKEVHLAEQESPLKQGMYLQEGIEAIESGDNQLAEQVFTKAYALDTSFSTVGVYAAAGDILNGQIPLGKSVLMQNFGTTTVDQDIILYAYYQVKDLPDFIAVWKQRVIDQHNADTAEFGLAAAYADSGDVADAKAELQTVVSQHPEDASQVSSYLSQINGK